MVLGGELDGGTKADGGGVGKRGSKKGHLYTIFYRFWAVPQAAKFRSASVSSHRYAPSPRRSLASTSVAAPEANAGKRRSSLSIQT